MIIYMPIYIGNVEGGELGLAIMSGRQNEFRESLEKTMEYASALNCNKWNVEFLNWDVNMDWSYTNKTYFVDNFRIHIMAGKKFSGIVDTAMDDVYKDNLEYAAKVFKEKGLIGLIEPISDIVIPNYFMNSVSKGKSFPCPAEA